MREPSVSGTRPVLTDDQWRRLQRHGVQVDVAAGTWLFRAGDDAADMLLVERGRVDIIWPAASDEAEAVVASYGPREFSGELNLLTQQAAYLSARAVEPSVVVRVGAAASPTGAAQRVR